MNRSVTLWLAVVAVVIVAGLAVFYAMNLASEPTPRRTTPATPPATTDAELNAEAAKNEQDLEALDDDFNAFGSIDTSQDNDTGI